MKNTPEKDADTVFPAQPPDKLIPTGYTGKVVIMWLSFFGIFIGIACSDGPFTVLLPVSSVSFLLSLTVLLSVKVREKPLWLYKEARSCFKRARYDKALQRLELISELRPETKKELDPIIIACRMKAKKNNSVNSSQEGFL